MVDTKKEETEIKTNWEESVDSFDALDLKPDLIRGIYGYGFVKPSVIQSKGVLPILKGRDTIAQAQSGTGKTATFAISVLQLIDETAPKAQALILAPTRELAQQIQRVVLCLGEYLNVNVHICTGGTNIMEDKKKLQEGAQIIVGTPGRVHDMLKKGVLKPDHLKLFVLDEADEMLGRGFQDQIKEIFKLIPGDVQIALFSATMPPEILGLTKDFMRNAATILVKNEELTLDGIKQFYIAIDKDEWKFDTLTELYNNIDIQQCIIYCNKKQRVDELTGKMKEKNFTVSSMVITNLKFVLIYLARRYDSRSKRSYHERIQNWFFQSSHHH
jgi:translation initiation factor 4A